jgi:hypothetical protein
VSNGGAKKRWPADVKASCLERAAVVGPMRAADEAGVPVDTVKSWQTRESRKVHAELARADLVMPVRTGMTWAERRNRILPALGELAEESVAAARLAVAEGRAKCASDFSSTAARMIDKATLLGGDVTSRSESRSLQVRASAQAVEQEREIAELEREIREIEARREAGGGA